MFITAAALIVVGIWLTFWQPDHGPSMTRFQTRRGEVAEIQSPSRGILLIFIGVLLLTLELVTAGWALERKETQDDDVVASVADTTPSDAPAAEVATNASPPAVTVATPSSAPQTQSGPCTQQSTVVLQAGCEGRAVEDLQQALRDGGFGDVEVDGEFGSHTEAALRLFEATRDNGSVDGQISSPSDEWSDLLARPLSTSPLVPSAQVGAVCANYVVYGCTGASASVLEQTLAGAGLLTSEINDTFGVRGWQALIRAQSCLGHVPDGAIEINGPEWQAIAAGAADGSLSRCS
jgi:peptidoglycan hydrolase-like protein with peptidoglycan-binding domain